jgi:hypothetical protein
MPTEGNRRAGANSSDSHPPTREIKWIGRRPWELSEREPYAAPASSIAFCEALAALFPALASVLAEHREEHRGETLAHLFMGDVARWYVERYLAGDSKAAKGLADWLDAEYPTADEYVRNVVDVSFLEALPWPPDPYGAAAELLGPNLSRELGDMQRWRPSS